MINTNYIFKLVILSVLEGITEVLPISSTSHILMLSYMLNINNDKFIEFYIIFIQIFAIIPIWLLYRKYIYKQIFSFIFHFKLIISIIPSIIIYLIFKNKIYLFINNIKYIIINTFIGGILLIIYTKYNKNLQYKNINIINSLIIGFYQSLSIIYIGLSRSGMCILGALSQNVYINNAIDFSYLISIPIMILSFIKNILDHYDLIYNVIYKNIHNVILYNILLIINSIITYTVSYYFSNKIITWLKNSKKNLMVILYYRIIITFIMYLLILYNYI